MLSLRRRKPILSNAVFFRYTLFSVEVCLGNPTQNYGLCLKSAAIWFWKSIYNFTLYCPIKEGFLPLSSFCSIYNYTVTNENAFFQKWLTSSWKVIDNSYAYTRMYCKLIWEWHAYFYYALFTTKKTYWPTPFFRIYPVSKLVFSSKMCFGNPTQNFRGSKLVFSSKMCLGNPTQNFRGCV